LGDSKRDRERTQTIQFSTKAHCMEGDKADCQAFLTVIRGGGADLGTTVEVGSRVRIGRDPKCELCLNDAGVSWRHAEIKFRDDGVYVIKDSGSTNGTRLDGRQLQEPAVLDDGKKIFLGETVVRFQLADEMEAEFQKEVAQIVATDSLTGLESKRRFDDAMDAALALARGNGMVLTVMMMDMDGIKQINDTHGHLYGAFCIAEAGKIIGKVLGSAGHACRWGGDEFSVFVPGMSRDEAFIVAEAVRDSIDGAHLTKNGIRLHPTISIGIACFPEDAEKVVDLIAAADMALYRAKALGKNRVSD